MSMFGLVSSVFFAVEAADAPESTDAAPSAECAGFADDIDADLGVRASISFPLRHPPCLTGWVRWVHSFSTVTRTLESLTFRVVS